MCQPGCPLTGSSSSACGGRAGHGSLVQESLTGLELSLQWFALDEVPRGKLHLKLEWLTLVPDAVNLDKVLCSDAASPPDHWDQFLQMMLLPN